MVAGAQEMTIVDARKKKHNGQNVNGTTASGEPLARYFIYPLVRPRNYLANNQRNVH